MAPRAIWKGHLKVAELNCAVALYSAASTSERISFHILNRKTKHRVRREYVDEETGKEVSREGQVKGYETSKGNYILLDAEEIASAVPASDKTLAVETFIPCGEVDTAYFDKPYYLAPADAASSQAFAVIREGLKAKSVAALAEAVLFRRVRAVMIRAQGRGLVANTLNFDYEVRPAEKAFDGIADHKIKGEMLDLAKHIIETKSGAFDPAEFDDRYDAALAELVKAKQEGRKIEKPKRQAKGEVIDLMAALRQSAGKGDKGKTKTARAKKQPAAQRKASLKMSLETYRKKRDFKATSEPSGRTRRSVSKGTGSSFVIQKHDARRLHYDFRIEVDGVLKSWAVTRGPSLVPGEKRLAVHVEDHPLEYGGFEGTIPKGEYGGGTVIVWDRGTWKSIGDFEKGLKKGHFEFELDGEKLNGRWHMVRMARRGREKRDNWLLIKGDDAFARTEDDPDILEEAPDSVKTGRAVADVENEAPGWSSKTGPLKKAPEKAKAPKGARKARYPGFIEPQLATLKPAAPEGKGWIHEIKFDGYRLQAHIRGNKTTLYTRSGLDWTEKFGKDVPAAFAKLPAKDAIIDGELVVEGAGGASDFSALQADLSEGRFDRFVFYAFDLLFLDGQDFGKSPLIARKERLRALLSDAPPAVRYSDHFEENGEIVLRHACRLSLEGVVSKKRDAAYRSGRGRDWIKSKCAERQEFVICGFTVSSTSSKAVGSLLLGYYENGKLVHAGRVGTGFTRSVAEDVFKQLKKVETDTSPYDEKLPALARRDARFVKPALVAEVEFRAWTADGSVRHASFRGLREDKPASEIVREEAAAKAAAEKPPRAVKLTHPDRVYWDDAGVTKEGLADYYSQVWARMAPFVVNRPLALLRCPTGISRQCFFQKHAWKGQSKEILTVHEALDDSDEPGIAIADLDGLIGLVQGATLEIHPWGASLDDIEKPDQIIMDLDPGEGVGWLAVIDAAGEVKERLEARGLATFVKTSGGKGLHVVAPVKPKADWDSVKAFTKAIADEMAGDDPDRYVATITKAKRKGKILVDYLRNGRGMTAVAPYSTRARPGAAVSMPLSWDELSPAIGPAHYTVNNALNRLAQLKRDPWEDFRAAETPIEARKTAGKRK